MRFSWIAPTAALVMAAGLGGCGQGMGDGSDFAVDIRGSLPEVYKTFSGITSNGHGLRGGGFGMPKVAVSRPSDHELVFTAPSAKADEPSRIAFAFTPGKEPGMTHVSATIDVPRIAMPDSGENMYLSETKIEDSFKDAVEDLARRMNADRSTSHAVDQLAVLLDTVAIASNPAKLRMVQAEIAESEARFSRFDEDEDADSGESFSRNEDAKGFARDGKFGEPSDGRQRTYAEKSGGSY